MITAEKKQQKITPALESARPAAKDQTAKDQNDQTERQMAKKQTAVTAVTAVTAAGSENTSGSGSTRAGDTAAKGAGGKSTVAKQTKAAVASVLEQNTVLKTTLQQIERQFGEGAIMPLGTDKQGAIQGIPTGSLSLDLALGGQGVPRGRVIEIFGPESSGKTTLALHVIAQAQRQGGIAAFIDAEHALDPSWAKKVGVELETLLVSQPTSGEEAMHITEMLIKSNAVDVIVIDSVAALIPRQELEGDIGDTHVGLQARLMSQSMRKLTGAIAKAKTSVIFINQIREKIGVMFGSPETTPGGRALKFYSSCRIDVRKIGMLKDGEEVVGQRVRAKVVKNKVAPPFRVAEFDMMHTNGISYEGDVMDLAVEKKVVVRSGAWFRYGDVQLGQGKEKARLFLVENPDVTEEIKQKVLVAQGVTKSGVLDNGAES
jgi:recombination protein RecA